MDDVTRHPDDATLFDLVEGALDPARQAGVTEHLGRCAACAAFVAAARAGAPETSSAVVAMPEAASERLHLRLAEGWRERTAAITAAEARADAQWGSPAAIVPDDDLVPPRVDPPRRRSARERWQRRLVPALAFAVLAALAGTSIWVGEDGMSPRGGAAGDETAQTAPDAATSDGMTVDGGTANEIAGSAGEPVGAPVPNADDAGAGIGAAADVATEAPTATATGGADARSQTSADPQLADREQLSAEPIEPIEPPAGAEEFAGLDSMLCVIVFDPAAYELPDGRVPQTIQAGPFGMFLVCG